MKVPCPEFNETPRWLFFACLRSCWKKLYSSWDKQNNVKIGRSTAPSSATGFHSSTVSRNISNINCYRIVDQPCSISFLLLCFFSGRIASPNNTLFWANHSKFPYTCIVDPPKNGYFKHSCVLVWLKIIINLNVIGEKKRLTGVLPDFRTTSRQRPP